LIGRRIPYVTRRLLQPAGMILWETLNQYYPPEFDNIAAQVRQKDSLGFFDIRVTDYPNKLLQDFISRIIPEELPAAREKFDKYKDLLTDYAYGELGYKGFAAKIRRRENGTNEDRDDEEQEDGSTGELF
jgi:hypothetical protein